MQKLVNTSKFLTRAALSRRVSNPFRLSSIVNSLALKNVKYYSTASNENPKQSTNRFFNSQFLSVFLNLWKQNIIRYGTIALTVISIVWILFDVSSWFSSITFKNVAEWSFFIGFFMGIGTMLSFFGVKRYFTLRSSSVYYSTLKKTLSSPQVRDHLGPQIKPGKYRTYSYIYDGVDEMSATWLRKNQFWKPVRMQINFSLIGKNNTTALVNAEVEKKSGLAGLGIGSERFIFHSLQIDIPDSEDSFQISEEQLNNTKDEMANPFH